ncbi:MAG: hypothetical protein AAF849_03170 [Bacteroidota bacterium]
MSNLQLELLELYNTPISNEELKDIKQLLSLYYAQKAIAAADAVWEKQNLSNHVMEQWMNKKMRTPYLTQKAFLDKPTAI